MKDRSSPPNLLLETPLARIVLDLDFLSCGDMRHFVVAAIHAHSNARGMVRAVEDVYFVAFLELWRHGLPFGQIENQFLVIEVQGLESHRTYPTERVPHAQSLTKRCVSVLIPRLIRALVPFEKSIPEYHRGADVIIVVSVLRLALQKNFQLAL